MEDMICYYQKDGLLKNKQPLNDANIADTNGMVIRCVMHDGRVLEGYSDPYRLNGEPMYDGKIHDYIYLGKWDHLNEDAHCLMGDNATRYDMTYTAVKISDIRNIDAILYSGPRWGGRLHNSFFIKTKDEW